MYFFSAVICTVSSCFIFAFPSHTSPAHSSFGTITFSRLHLLILVSRCESIRIASILPTCALPCPITFATCASHEHSFEISTPRYVYWAAIGNSCSPHYHLKVTGFSLSSLHTTTAHFCTSAVTLHFLVYYSDLSICFCNPSGVSDIPTKSSANINPDTAVSPPIVTPCHAAWTATIMSLICTLNKFRDNVHPCATPCKISTCFDIFCTLLLLALSHLTIDYASLSERGTVPDPSKRHLHSWALITLFFRMFHGKFLLVLSPCCFAVCGHHLYLLG